MLKSQDQVEGKEDQGSTDEDDRDGHGSWGAVAIRWFAVGRRK